MARGDHHRARFGRLRRRGRCGELWRRGRRHARPYRRGLRRRDGAIARACAAGRCACPISTRSALALRCALRPAAAAPGFSLARAARAMGLWRRDLERQGHAFGPLGDRRHAGRLRLGLFPASDPAFPAVADPALIAEAKLPGILGDRHASGTAIIDELGEEHMRTGKPICYTSADSVFQIAAHEEAFGLERLYDLCRIARRLCDPLTIGRVIARPFVGDVARPISPAPPIARISRSRRCPAICLQRAPRRGARSSRSARSATSSPIATPGRRSKAQQRRAPRSDARRFARDGRRRLDLRQSRRFRHRIWPSPRRRRLCRLPRSLRRATAGDRSGAARRRSLRVDRRPRQRSDLARHDHTREHVPILAFGGGVAAGPIGARASLADIGATLAHRLGVARAGAWRELARMSFALDPRLAADTLAIGDLALSRVLLMNDARYPWLILVPRREGLRELVDLDRARARELMEEIARASASFCARCRASTRSMSARSAISCAIACPCRRPPGRRCRVARARVGRGQDAALRAQRSRDDDRASARRTDPLPRGLGRGTAPLSIQPVSEATSLSIR